MEKTEPNVEMVDNKIFPKEKIEGVKDDNKEPEIKSLKFKVGQERYLKERDAAEKKKKEREMLEKQRMKNKEEAEKRRLKNKEDAEKERIAVEEESKKKWEEKQKKKHAKEEEEKMVLKEKIEENKKRAKEEEGIRKQTKEEERKRWQAAQEEEKQTKKKETRLYISPGPLSSRSRQCLASPTSPVSADRNKCKFVGRPISGISKAPSVPQSKKSPTSSTKSPIESPVISQAKTPITGKGKDVKNGSEKKEEDEKILETEHNKGKEGNGEM